MRTKYTMRLWNWNELFHEAVYEFDTPESAHNFLLGLWGGVQLTGQKLTGMYMEEVNNN